MLPILESERPPCRGERLPRKPTMQLTDHEAPLRGRLAPAGSLLSCSFYNCACKRKAPLLSVCTACTPYIAVAVLRHRIIPSLRPGGVPSPRAHPFYRQRRGIFWSATDFALFLHLFRFVILNLRNCYFQTHQFTKHARSTHMFFKVNLYNRSCKRKAPLLSVCTACIPYKAVAVLRHRIIPSLRPGGAPLSPGPSFCRG